MKTKKLLLCFVAGLLSLGNIVTGQSELISRIPDGGVGKQIVSIHSYSDQTKHQEGPLNLLLPKAETNDDKWCDNKTEEPWVIFELSNIYEIDRFEIVDAQIREKSNGNVAEYKIYVTTDEIVWSDLLEQWEEPNWEEVYHGQDEGSIVNKQIILSSAKKARYVKFHVIDKGKRADNGDPENAVRIYGFDIFGTFDHAVDRGNLISVGKTVMAYYNRANDREGPGNLMDANFKNVNNKWCFEKVGYDKPYRYVVIDLERQYDISEFKLYDCQLLDAGNNNLAGCNIYVSEVAPDLNLLTPEEADKNICWTKVVDSQDESDIKEKVYTLPTDIYSSSTIKGRFVKLEIPMEKIEFEKATRLYQFEVYGEEAAVPANDATLSLLSVSTGILSPIFNPSIKKYTVAVPKEVEKITVKADATSSKATVNGAATYDLAIGDNTINIDVTAENTTSNERYTIIVTRAEKSKIATLESINILPWGSLSTDFHSDSLKYNVDVKLGTTQFDIVVAKTQAEAKVVGDGIKQLSGDGDEFEITVTAEDGESSVTYTLTVYIAPENLISVNYGEPTGKRIVNIHSYSGKAHDEESPYKLMVGERKNTNGNKRNKWCDNSAEPWVIFSLTDIYSIEKIVIRDAKVFEPTMPNIDEYEIYFSLDGTDPDYDFDYIDGEFGVSDADVKEIEFGGEKARYIMFRTTKPDGEPIRIYGMDIYGTLAEKVERGDLVSVGKTIVDFSSCAGDRETPTNLLDGNINYTLIDSETGMDKLMKNDPWAFNAREGDAYVIIDLEEQYSGIYEFKAYDTSDWINGYKVSLSTTGNEGDWTQVADKTFEPVTEPGEPDDNGEIKDVIVGPDPKVITLESPQRGRYVKVEFPLAMQSENWNRIREFEVYANGASGFAQIKPSVDKLIIAPNPLQQGDSFKLNETGLLRIYSLQGALVYEKQIEEATTVSTSNFSQGSYIVELSNVRGIQQGKLIVK